MKRLRQLTTSGSRTAYGTKPAHGKIALRRKRLGLMLLCGMLLCGTATGCAKAQGKTAAKEETAQNTGTEETQDMGSTNSGITGTIVVTTREEKEAADQVVQKLFNALEAGDEKAIRGLFSPFALENATDLDGKIRELIAYYPGADGGYDGAAISKESRDKGKYMHVLEIILTVTNEGQEYDLVICLQMENEFEPSKEGVHLIEIMKQEDEPAGFKWKTKDAAPGVYVAE